MNQSNPEFNDRPCLILGYVHSEFAAHWGRYFRRHGWEVHLAASAVEARRLSGIVAPTVVVLDVDMPDESGWLASVKLAEQCPGVKILLVGSRAPKRSDDVKDVGAIAWLGRDDHPELALDEILGRRLVSA